MSWNKILKETKTLAKTCTAILELNFPKDGDIQHSVLVVERPPNITITFHVVSDDMRRAYEVDGWGERVKQINDNELSKIGGVMGEIADLPSVHYCHKNWAATGVLTYKLGVDYAQFLGGKKHGKDRRV